jgi:ornithine carbamoyltransferase
VEQVPVQDLDPAKLNWRSLPRHFLTGTELTADELTRLLDRAAAGAFALHCLPAHPGEEITAAVLYGERQRIWDQAENRRHAQKGLLEWLVPAVG